jgi:hypothetical protein
MLDYDVQESIYRDKDGWVSAVAFTASAATSSSIRRQQTRAAPKLQRQIRGEASAHHAVSVTSNQPLQVTFANETVLGKMSGKVTMAAALHRAAAVDGEIPDEPRPRARRHVKAGGQ